MRCAPLALYTLASSRPTHDAHWPPPSPDTLSEMQGEMRHPVAQSALIHRCSTCACMAFCDEGFLHAEVWKRLRTERSFWAPRLSARAGQIIRHSLHSKHLKAPQRCKTLLLSTSAATAAATQRPCTSFKAWSKVKLPTQRSSPACETCLPLPEFAVQVA